MINKWLLRLLISLLCLVIAIYLLIWSLSPILVRYFGNQSLSEFGLSLSQESSVRYNPFLSRLSIDKLSLQRQEKPVFTIDSAVFEVNLHQLHREEVYLKTLNIKGLNLEISEEADGLVVAGFPTGNSQKPAPEPSSEKKATTPLVIPYRLLAPQLTLEDAVIRFTDSQTTHLIEIKKFALRELAIDQFQQQASMELLVNIAQGSFALNSELDIEKGIGVLTSNVKLDNISIDEFMTHLPEPVKATVKSINGLLSLNLNAKMAIESVSPTKELANTPHDLSQLMPKSLQVDGTIALNKWKVASAHKEQVLTQWDGLTVKGIQTSLLFADIPKTLQLNIKSVVFNKLSSSDVLPANADLPPLSSINKLHLSDLAFKNNALMLSKITVEGMHNNIVVGKDKALKTLVVINDQTQPLDVQQSEPASAAVSKKSQSESDHQSAFQFIIKELLLSGGSTVYFRDESVEPTYERTLFIDKLQATNINSHPDERTNFSLVGRSNTYATIDLSGYAYPFSEKVNFGLEGNIKEVNLPPISSYLQDSLGFELKSGDLDLTINVKIAESELDGQTKLSIRGLETSKPQAPNINILQKSTPLSLNAALNFLKDKRGNITLDVPMRGRVNDPDFGMNSLIQLIARRAATAQVRRYALTFVPYANVISVAMTTGELLLRVRFEDLLYSPMQVTLEEGQKGYVEQFVALMKDKPKLQVKVCGFGVATDLNEKERNKRLTVADLTSSQTERLRTIAQQRSEIFKDHAVNKGKIESSRILLCNPQMDFQEEAKPRIEIEI